MARPMPRDAPVTMATFPASVAMNSSFYLGSQAEFLRDFHSADRCSDLSEEPIRFAKLLLASCFVARQLRRLARSTLMKGSSIFDPRYESSSSSAFASFRSAVSKPSVNQP
jgi:hypothetical protein